MTSLCGSQQTFECSLLFPFCPPFLFSCSHKSHPHITTSQEEAWYHEFMYFISPELFSVLVLYVVPIKTIQFVWLISLQKGVRCIANLWFSHLQWPHNLKCKLSFRKRRSNLWVSLPLMTPPPSPSEIGCHYVALAGLKHSMYTRLALTHSDTRTSVSWVLGLKSCDTMTGSFCLLLKAWC